jgi:phenylacetate-CoA ligase
MKFQNLYDLYRIRAAQWKSPEEIRCIQERKLTALISHAYRRVPYYRGMFDALRIKPEDIRSSGDLKALPVTTKKRLNELPFEEKVAGGTDLSSCRASSTSGTTGIPLTAYFSAGDMTLINLSWARAFLSCGVKPWHKTAAFIGQPQVNRNRSWYERFGMWRRYEISTWTAPEDWVESLRRIRPQVLTGYVMTLKLLAEELRERHPDLRRPGFLPRIVLHSSAILDGASRRQFESAFGASVFDLYGADEAGCMAWECPACGAYHINADMVIVEFLKDGRPIQAGEEGEIVVTSLHSSVMPFIRYSLGDIGALSLRTIRCGRGLPLMERIQGRIDDFIILQTGERISPHPFYHCLDPVPGIRRWQIIQHEPRKITVTLEAGRGFSEDTVRLVKANLEGLLKGRMDIEIRTVDSISVLPSVKFRAVRSEIGSGPRT